MMWLYFIKASNTEAQLRAAMHEKINFEQRYECQSLTKEFPHIVKADEISSEYTSFTLSGPGTIYRLKNNAGTVFVPSSHEKCLYKWLCQNTPSTKILKENGQEIYFISIEGGNIVFSNTWSPVPVEHFSTPGAKHHNALYPLYEAAIRRYIQNPDTYLTSDEFQATQLIP